MNFVFLPLLSIRLSLCWSQRILKRDDFELYFFEIVKYDLFGADFYPPIFYQGVKINEIFSLHF